MAAAAKRAAGIKGDMDHFGPWGSYRVCSSCCGTPDTLGLLLVLDEIDSGRFPGLYLVITGTPAFFDGPSGVQRLNPLAGRLATDFTTDARFDNPRG